MTIAAIIVAAGRGRRLGGETPKQYLPVAGTTVLRRSVEAFLAIEAVAWVLSVIHQDDRGLYDAAMEGADGPRLMPPVSGGDTRAASVRRGLEALEAEQPELVLIHDAARAFVSRDVIERVISGMNEAEGACAALPVVDALWRETDDGQAGAALPRDGLWRAQTPQGFRFAPILAAHRGHDGSALDDVAVARAAGMNVKLVLGSERNYKITTQDDYDRACAEAVRHQP